MKRIIPIIILLFIIAAFFIFGLDENLNFDELALKYADLSAFVGEKPVLSIVIAMFIYIVATAFSFPVAWLLSVSVGLIFGFFIGSFIVLFGATIGATILFLLAKYAFADFFKKRSGDFLTKMAKGFRNGAASYLLFLRLVPIFPFALVNVMPAILNVRLFTFIWTTFVGIIPGVIAYIYAGVGLRSIIKERAIACKNEIAPCGQVISPSDFITKEMIFAFILLGVVALIPVVLKNLKGKKNNEKS